jgi:hypothetical protein
MEQCTQQMIIHLPAKKRDELFLQLNNEIQDKKQFLLDKREQLDKQLQTNDFLYVVKEDYKKFYDIILQQKREQYVALLLLNKYIGQIRESGELSKNNHLDAQLEQKKILEELSKIKKSIRELTHRTDV